MSIKINKLFSFCFLLSLFIIIAGSLPFFATAATTSTGYATGNSITDKLLDIAQAKLDAEYQILLDGDIEKLKKTKDKLTGAAAESVNEVSTKQYNIYKMSADRGVRYTNFTSKLVIENVDISKDRAVITTKENATRTLLSNDSKDPILTKEARSHRFYFTLTGSQWSLDKDEDLDRLIPVEQEPGIELGKVQKLPNPLTDNKKFNKANPEERNKFKKEQANLFLSFLIKPAFAVSGSYNPTSAVNYVRSYAYNYNTAYRPYDNDCTNFMSQAMNWSG